MLGPAEILLYSQMIMGIAEGVSRIIEVSKKMQNGEQITPEDLAAARQRTDEAMARLEAAVKANANRQEPQSPAG